MIEARAFVGSLDSAREALDKEQAVNQGRYRINDSIYRNYDAGISLVDEFLRLREVPENIWNEKEVILALKQTDLRKVGKRSRIPLKLQFDHKSDAEAYYIEHLQNEYLFDFSFSRVGWQYFLPNGDIVDLEIVEDKYPTIEFKSKTDAGIEQLAKLLSIQKHEVITGPSVVAVKRLLKV